MNEWDYTYSLFGESTTYNLPIAIDLLANTIVEISIAILSVN